MDQSKFRYIIRIGLDPDFEPNERIDAITRFCGEGDVEEIMLQIMPEELSTGHLCEEEIRKNVTLAADLKSSLETIGVELSVQPWCTTYHNYRGRQLKQGQNFRRLVGENGYKNAVAVCPLCEKWQHHMGHVFATFAEHVSPRTLWIEDDFRLHNHDGYLTGWGGCFCDEHLRRFSEIVGQEVTRKELRKNILAKGRPHPWRQQWIDLSWQSIYEPAKKIRRAVDAVDETIDLALMCSMPDKHSVEGRRWNELADCLRNERPFVVRPHLHPYTEEIPISHAPVFARQTINEFDCPVTIYPELECGPRGGSYTKSYRFMNWQCETSALFGSDGITINCFDVIGNGTLYSPNLGRTLASKKARLGAIKSLDIDDAASQGISILYHPDVAANLDCPRDESMVHLEEHSDIAARTIAALGISYKFVRCVSDITPDTPVLLSGQHIRCFDEDQILKILSGPVILDGIAADSLQEMGFAQYLGIRQAHWSTQLKEVYSYESVCEEDPGVYGIANPRMSAQRGGGRILNIEPAGDADILSEIKKADGTYCFPGLITYQNSLGGTVATIGYALDGGAGFGWFDGGGFFMGFFNPVRRMLVQHLVKQIAPRAKLAMETTGPRHLYRIQQADQLLIAVSNVSLDKAEYLELDAPDLDGKKYDLRFLEGNGNWQPSTMHRANGKRYKINRNVDCFETVVMQIDI